MSKLLNLF